MTLLNGCYKLLQEEFVIHPNLIKSLPVESKVNFLSLEVTTAFEGAAIAAKQSLLLQTLSLLLSLKEITLGTSDADKSNNLFDLSGLRVF